MKFINFNTFLITKLIINKKVKSWLQWDDITCKLDEAQYQCNKNP